ncbi:helix-turn-helix transcriptional regulator [Chitinophaga pinensis]|uniref:Transcriptional regulator, AraC family n=1 Tax=Chitinophaga pinensis (strain ATCC 43595 / DSM 2588 / LMG 13176 / NBRC 15968 / NCIMB 11800 / UQM 2034) TaxID=485918 RepID=A0A979H063_CHIPD|nr:AraC family transcriptional regulator [Chitinophaga pinensis]ACU63125.1 transcriptional regulator, AraC family [Chitinophaga pinensis DSM 2588]
MKISITDRGTGITREFAHAIGAAIRGRFIDIPENMGTGYITGFSWGKELRMMIRNYYLKEDVYIERTNKLEEGQEDIVFLLSGIFPSILQPDEQILPEQANIMICKHAVSSVLAMPSNTMFGSVTIAVAKQYLHQLFGKIDHPVVASVLEGKDNFVFETGISTAIINTASGMLGQPVPETLESHYYKLKCEELLCYVFTMLMQREIVPATGMHIDDIKAIYAIKARLQAKLDEPPNIAALAKEAGMSEPKLRKLFKQTFGKGVFEYYQSGRMQEAARLLKERRLTVSEVGYQLGFTNLSHFSRVFEQYMGSKPKKYSKT